MKADRRKISAIVDMPEPEDRLALRRLLGMATHLARYVPNFSDVTAKLRELLAEDVDSGAGTNLKVGGHLSSPAPSAGKIFYRAPPLF